MNENLETQELQEMQSEESVTVSDVMTDEQAENPENLTPEVKTANVKDVGNAPEEEIAEENSDMIAAEVEAKIAEAEHRGYLRGLNERAERLMQRPAPGEANIGQKAEYHTDDEVMILNNIRKSIWDI